MYFKFPPILMQTVTARQALSELPKTAEVQVGLQLAPSLSPPLFTVEQDLTLLEKTPLCATIKT